MLAQLLALGAAGLQAAPLEAWRWQSRVVLLFATAPGSPELDAQRALLAGSEDAARDRDLLRIEVVGQRVTALPPVDGLPDAATLRAHYAVADERPFLLLLVGKDGGVKLRAETPQEACALYGLIDGMVMRRSERHQDRAPDPCRP